MERDAVEQPLLHSSGLAAERRCAIGIGNEARFNPEGKVILENCSFDRVCRGDDLGAGRGSGSPMQRWPVLDSFGAASCQSNVASVPIVRSAASSVKLLAVRNTPSDCMPQAGRRSFCVTRPAIFRVFCESPSPVGPDDRDRQCVGVEKLVSRQAHNLEIVGSSPTPGTT